jgi:hypothetical protein
MDDGQALITAIYAGWRNYQGLLITALTPLTPAELAYQSSPNLRTIEEIATHMIGARGRWFSPPLGDGNKQLAVYSHWDRRDEPVRAASEIIEGLQFTFDYIQSTVARWTPDDWSSSLAGEGPFDPIFDTRQWVIRHSSSTICIMDEISLTMGMHNLKAPEL